MAKPELILASTSKYRQEQLKTLGIEFSVMKQPVDETPQLNELPQALAIRLASAKAAAVASIRRDAIVIGADQVAAVDRKPVGKPGTVVNAVNQLEQASGRQMNLYTAFSVYRLGVEEVVDSEIVEIQFRKLTISEIKHYVILDSPLDCAGAVKSESRGSMLFESVKSSDPSAIIGLPLIKLCRALRTVGINPLE